MCQQEVYLEDFGALQTEKRILILESLAVRMAEKLPASFDAHIQGAVSKAKRYRELFLSSEVINPQGLSAARDFKYHFFRPIGIQIIRDMSGDTTIKENSWHKVALQCQKIEFNEAFSDDFIRKISISCSNDEQEYLLRYFGSAFFCMRLFNNASNCVEVLHGWNNFVNGGTDLFSDMFLAMYRSKDDMHSIKNGVQLLYDSMWSKYDNMPEIDSDHLLDVYDGQRLIYE